MSGDYEYVEHKRAILDFKKEFKTWLLECYERGESAHPKRSARDRFWKCQEFVSDTVKRNSSHISFPAGDSPDFRKQLLARVAKWIMLERRLDEVLNKNLMPDDGEVKGQQG